MNSDEYTEFEGRAYINPTLSSGEQQQFISNLRDLQAQNNAQIAQQTYNLGTDIPSNLGGLGGGEAYFMSRYQTPQVNEMVATLDAAAQAQALNDVMKNYQGQLQNRYKQAYRRAQKRARAAAAANANKGQNIGDNIEMSDSGKTATAYGTSAPIEGHTTTSYYDGSNWVTVDETTGEKYINGVKQKAAASDSVGDAIGSGINFVSSAANIINALPYPFNPQNRLSPIKSGYNIANLIKGN